MTTVPAALSSPASQGTLTTPSVTGFDWAYAYDGAGRLTAREQPSTGQPARTRYRTPFFQLSGCQARVHRLL